MPAHVNDDHTDDHGHLTAAYCQSNTGANHVALRTSNQQWADPKPDNYCAYNRRANGSANNPGPVALSDRSSCGSDPRARDQDLLRHR